MKFLVIKDLDPSGQISASWLTEMKASLLKSPEKLRKDYATLVESIARLQVIETTLRNEVLHMDEKTKEIKDIARDWMPIFSSSLNDVGSKLSNLGLQLFNAAIAGATSRLVSKL